MTAHDIRERAEWYAKCDSCDGGYIVERSVVDIFKTQLEAVASQFVCFDCSHKGMTVRILHPTQAGSDHDG